VSVLDEIKALWATLDKDGREQHLAWTLAQCATCGQPGAENGFYCDACCEEGMASTEPPVDFNPGEEEAW
jgi:hypothetical protein